jgi:hypothetical protein
VKLNEAVLKEIVRIAREQLVNTVTNMNTVWRCLSKVYFYFFY